MVMSERERLVIDGKANAHILRVMSTLWLDEVVPTSYVELVKGGPMHDMRASHSHIEIISFSYSLVQPSSPIFQAGVTLTPCAVRFFPTTPADSSLPFEPCTCCSCEHVRCSFPADGRGE